MSRVGRDTETFATAHEPARGIEPELNPVPELERQDKVERLVSWKAY